MDMTAEGEGEGGVGGRGGRKRRERERINNNITDWIDIPRMHKGQSIRISTNIIKKQKFKKIIIETNKWSQKLPPKNFMWPTV
jgi:hypothetical protein